MGYKAVFRAKRKDNDEWIEGYYANLGQWLDDSDVHIIIPFGTTLFPHCEIGGFEEIIPETLCRLLEHPCYDAFYDNVRIFQNDIVAIWERHADIDKSDPIGVALVVDECTISEDGSGRWFPQDTIRVKVIGNAYDNPELLTGHTMNRFINGLNDYPDDYCKRHPKLIKECGVHGAHACCYLCNFESDYICHQYNGGCPRIEECRWIHNLEQRGWLTDSGDEKGE